MDSVAVAKEFLEVVVTTLVNEPQDVRVVTSIDERGVLLELHVSPEDIGRVIGRSGDTAKAIRELLRTLGKKHNAYFSMKVVEDA